MSSSTERVCRKYCTLSATSHWLSLLCSSIVVSADWPKTGLTLNNSRADSVGVLCALTNIEPQRVWWICGNLSWSADFNCELAQVGVVTRLVLVCGCASFNVRSSQMYRGEISGDGVSWFACSFVSDVIAGHEIARGTPLFSSLGLGHLRGTTGLTRASAGDSDKARLLLHRGPIILTEGSGLKILRWGMRTPEDRVDKLSSRLSWGECRVKNGESGRVSSPLTSWLESHFFKLTACGKIIIYQPF